MYVYSSSRAPTPTQPYPVIVLVHWLAERKHGDRPPFYWGRGLSDVWNMAAHGLSTEELYRCYEVLEGAKGEAASEVCAGGPT